MTLTYTVAALAVFLLLCGAVLAIAQAGRAARWTVAVAMAAGAVAVAFAITAEVRVRTCESDASAATRRWEARHPELRSSNALLEAATEARVYATDPPPSRVCQREPF